MIHDLLTAWWALCAWTGAASYAVLVILVAAAIVDAALDRWQAYRVTVRCGAYPDPKPLLRVMDGGQCERDRRRRA